MNTIIYLFWRFWKFRVNKENDKDSAYLFVTIFFGLFFIFIPMLIYFGLYCGLPNLTLPKIIQYLLIIPIIFVCSIPFQLLFKRNKIFNLKYSSYEIKKHDKRLLVFIYFMLFSLLLKIVIKRY